MAVGLGGGGIGGGIGSGNWFGGGFLGFASGGEIQPNSTALVGEQGPEFTTGNQQARVHNAGATNQLLSQYTGNELSKQNAER